MGKVSSKMTHRQRGLTMVEIMAALVIFSAVTVGALSLNGRTIKDSRLSYANSQANLLAAQMIDLIRLNVTEGNKDQFVVSDNVVLPGVDASETSDVQRAQRSLNLWTTAVLDSLPPGSRYQIRRNGQFFDVTLLWPNDGTKFKRDSICEATSYDPEKETCLTVYALICDFKLASTELRCS